jgi:PPK2 family polyphosphate:nucleotide phosphotransferase
MHEQPLVITETIKLKHFDPGYSAGLDKDKTKKKAEELVQRIGDLQDLLYANSNCAVLLLFQGMDASGKDGSVRHVLKHVNPIGVEAANFKVPSDEERAHDFLWRVHRVVPRYGNIGVFNRSHYEAVLVERVLGLVTHKGWLQRYEQIVAWERMLVENRVVVLKFFLHLSREEQAQRLRERLSNPRKNWKFSPADLIVRKQWDAYGEAYEDMLNATSHKRARWHIIPADHNWYRDFVVAEIVVKAMESLHLKWPKPKQDLSKIRVR